MKGILDFYNMIVRIKLTQPANLKSVKGILKHTMNLTNEILMEKTTFQKLVLKIEKAF